MSIVCLLNDSPGARERNSEERAVQECGCASSPTRWLQMCREHGTLSENLHQAAAAEHRLAASIKELTT